MGWVLALFLFLPFVSQAEITQLKFTSEAQTIKPNVISDKITIQTTDSSSAPEKAVGTFRFNLETNSATGRFVTSTGNPVDNFYISSGTASRSFYYIDSSSGPHTLKVSTTTSGVSSDEQIIIVNESGGGVATTTATSTPTTESSNEENPPQSSGGGGGAPSAHSGQSELTNLIVSPFKIGAGRNRLVLAGTPLSFSAYKDNSPYSWGAKFRWSFGDGTEAEGEKVSHIYRFPGEYNVVLNASFSDGSSSVSRTLVLVEEPKVAISALNFNQGYLEIWNQGINEANINEWFLVSSSTRYQFPKDTIVKSGGRVKVPLAVTKLDLSGQSVFLARADGQMAGVLATGGLSALPKVSLEQEERVVKAVTQKLGQIEKEVKQMTVAKKAGLPYQNSSWVPDDFSYQSQLTGASFALNSALTKGKSATTSPSSSKEVIVLKKDKGLISGFWRGLEKIFKRD